MFTKGLHFSEDFGRWDFYNGVREGFFGKSGKEDNGMTSDLTADKERLTKERRKGSSWNVYDRWNGQKDG